MVPEASELVYLVRWSLEEAFRLSFLRCVTAGSAVISVRVPIPAARPIVMEEEVPFTPSFAGTRGPTLRSIAASWATNSGVFVVEDWATGFIALPLGSDEDCCAGNLEVFAEVVGVRADGTGTADLFGRAEGRSAGDSCFGLGFGFEALEPPKNREAMAGSQNLFVRGRTWVSRCYRIGIM